MGSMAVHREKCKGNEFFSSLLAWLSWRRYQWGQRVTLSQLTLNPWLSSDPCHRLGCQLELVMLFWALWWQKVELAVYLPFWWPENILWLASILLLWVIWIIIIPVIFFIEKCAVCHRPLERMNKPVAHNDQKQFLVHHSAMEIFLQPLFLQHFSLNIFSASICWSFHHRKEFSFTTCDEAASTHKTS